MRVVNAPPRIMVGATALTPGVSGYVPTPTAGNETTEFLRKDGTYAVPAGGVGGSILADGSVTNAKVAANAAIALSKLATDPLARANHTGTQAQSTVTNLVTDLAGKAASVHAHAATDITSGVLGADRLATGAALQVFRRNAANTAIECATISVGGGDLLAANNLSDLTSAATARTNLGFGNVNNTSDANKPISTATQTALDLKATDADLDAHVADVANPHAVTKTQVGLANVTNDVQTKAAVVPNTAPSAGQILAGNAGGTAYAPVSLSGDATLDSAGALTIAADAVTNAKLANAAANTVKVNATAGSDNPADLAMAASTFLARLAAGNIVAATVSEARTLLVVSNVDNTSDANKPISTATQTALDLKATDADLDAHTAATNNPHSVTKAQVGLGNVTNDVQLKAADLDTDVALTADSDTKIPSQKAVKAYVDGVAAAGIADDSVTNAKLAEAAANTVKVNATAGTANPTDLAMAASTFLARLAAGNIVAATVAEVKTLLALVKADVGLGSVTDDAQTKAAIVPNTAPSAGQILAGNAGGTAYAPVSVGGDATLSDAGALTIAADAVTNAKQANMAANTVKVNATAGSENPADLAMAASTFLARLAAGNIVAATVTEARMLLVVNNVDNTSDANKPVSTATQTALDLKVPLTMVENSPILLPATLTADGKYAGICEGGTAAAALTFGQIVYFVAASSRWALTDADADSTSGAVRVGVCVLAAAANGNPTRILTYGRVRADAAFPALTIGAPVYISTTAGAVQTAQPSGTDDVIRILGYGVTADEMFFCPSNDYMTRV